MSDTTLTFDVRSWQQGRDYRLALIGELDCASADALRAAIGAAEHRRPVSITVDLGGLTFMDSTGINAFVEAGRRARLGGWAFAVSQAGGQPLRALDALRMPTTAFDVRART